MVASNKIVRMANTIECNAVKCAVNAVLRDVNTVCAVKLPSGSDRSGNVDSPVKKTVTDCRRIIKRCP